jgi:Ser/Thr protein kinase RdoA (MazF antagonist)
LDAPEGTRYAVLFSFGQGAKIRDLTVELSYQIGQLMANMHQATHNQRINRTVYTADYLGHQAYGQVKPYFSESLEEMKFIKGAAEKLVSVFDHSPAPDLRQGIVHLDIWYDNMSITESGEITLFDFDNCGNGWLVLDIGYFCMQLFYTQPDKKEYEKKFAAFLNGYREAAPLSDQEISLIPYAGLAIWIYYLGVQAQRFDNFSNIFFTENYLKMYMGRVREWLTYTHTEPIIV